MKTCAAFILLALLVGCGRNSSRIIEIPQNALEKNTQSQTEEKIAMTINECRLQEMGNLYQTIVRWAIHNAVEVKNYDEVKTEGSLEVIIDAISDLSQRALSGTVYGRSSLEKLQYPEKSQSAEQLEVIAEASEYLAENMIKFDSSSENAVKAAQCASSELDCLIEVSGENLIIAAQILGSHEGKSPTAAIQRYRDCE